MTRFCKCIKKNSDFLLKLHSAYTTLRAGTADPVSQRNYFQFFGEKVRLTLPAKPRFVSKFSLVFRFRWAYHFGDYCSAK